MRSFSTTNGNQQLKFVSIPSFHPTHVNRLNTIGLRLHNLLLWQVLARLKELFLQAVMITPLGYSSNHHSPIATTND